MSEELKKFIDDVLSDEPSEVKPDGTPVTFEEKYERFMGDIRRHLLEDLGPVRLHELQGEAEQRYSTVMPLGTMRSTTIALIGLGGLGNWISKVLVSMGFKNLHVFDVDTVGPENLGPQAHKIIDIGLQKTEAVRRECLELRGIELAVHNVKVEHLSDIAEDLGCRPEIVIGATDSAEFRNNLIADMNPETADPELVPDLFVDLRMSLGDWNAFLWTPKAILGHMPGETYEEEYNSYVQMAVFPPEEAVMEPCTARSITYTGANVASYVGALLHWWLSEGKRHCENGRHWLKYSFYNESRDDTEFNWLYRFSSREFMPETFTEEQRRKLSIASTAQMTEAALRNMLQQRWRCGYPNSINADQWDNSFRPMLYITPDGEERLVLRGSHTFNDPNTGSRKRFPYMLHFDLAYDAAEFVPHSVTDAGRVEASEVYNRNRGDMMLSMPVHDSGVAKALNFPTFSLIHDPAEGSKDWETMMALDAIHTKLDICPVYVRESFSESRKFPYGIEILFNALWIPDTEELYLLKLFNPGVDNDDGVVRYSVSAYRLRGSVVGQVFLGREEFTTVALRLLRNANDYRVYTTGWMRPGKSSEETDFRLLGFHESGTARGIREDAVLPADIRTALYEAIVDGQYAGTNPEDEVPEVHADMSEGEAGSDLLIVAAVEDGKVVTVDGVDGQFTKHSSGESVWLEETNGGGLTVRVNPHVMVRVVEGE